MHLPDAPIAFTVNDLNKSKDFYVRILDGKVRAARAIEADEDDEESEHSAGAT